MKSIIVTYILFLALTSFRSTAETFITSPGETNSIVVATNEAIIVDFQYGGGSPSGGSPSVFRQNGLSSQVIMSKGSAFAGPCELLYTNTEALVTFHRIQTLAMTTLVPGDGKTNTVVVPSGKTLKLFPISYGEAVVSRNTNSIRFPNWPVDWELTGPLTVQFIGSTTLFGTISLFYTYYIVEDFIEITADGYLKGPTGTFEVLVEKSTDLAQWQPVMVQNTASADARAFYRLRIQK